MMILKQQMFYSMSRSKVSHLKLVVRGVQLRRNKSARGDNTSETEDHCRHNEVTLTELKGNHGPD